jgi:hypothetical protein
LESAALDHEYSLSQLHNNRTPFDDCWRGFARGSAQTPHQKTCTPSFWPARLTSSPPVCRRPAGITTADHRSTHASSHARATAAAPAAGRRSDRRGRTAPRGWDRRSSSTSRNPWSPSSIPPLAGAPARLGDVRAGAQQGIAAPSHTIARSRCSPRHPTDRLDGCARRVISKRATRWPRGGRAGFRVARCLDVCRRAATSRRLVGKMSAFLPIRQDSGPYGKSKTP